MRWIVRLWKYVRNGRHDVEVSLARNIAEAKAAIGEAEPKRQQAEDTLDVSGVHEEVERTLALMGGHRSS